MEKKYSKGMAFILEGDTEKVFYFALLNYFCSKHQNASVTKNINKNGEIFYILTFNEEEILIKFYVVGTISQVANSGSWFEKRFFSEYKDLNWTVFLCYDTDNYISNVSKFYEGDWAELRRFILKHRKCKIIDMAAQADIEDIMLVDVDSIFKFLSMNPVTVPSGSKGKMKMKKLFRLKGPGVAYHEGTRAEPLIKSLNFEKIIKDSPVPLVEIEKECFGIG